MALTLVATAAGESSNTYCTLVEADSYHETRLHNEDWTDANDTNKNAALVWATRLLDEMVDWVGTKYTTAQALRWPRSGAYNLDNEDYDYDTIPQWLKNATAEFAMYLLSEDRQAEDDMMGFKEITLDVITLKADKYDRPHTIPKSVWDIIQPYGILIRKHPRTLTRI